MAIKSYLRGGVGITTFRKLVTTCLCDHRITSVLWVGCPSRVINLGPEDGMTTTKMCRDVREQILKMLSVGAIEWTGFTSPAVQPHTTDSTPRKKSKQIVQPHTTDSTLRKKSKQIV